MVVILEGCDCAGKSTCFDMMDKSSGRFEKGVAGADMEFARANLEMDLLLDLYVVHDRHPLIDDLVYSQVFTHEQSKYIDRLDEISKLINQCLIIYFECDDNVIAQRMAARGDDYVTKSQIPEIKSEYERVFELLKVNPMRVDTTNADPETVFNKVMEVINHEKLKNS